MAPGFYFSIQWVITSEILPYLHCKCVIGACDVVVNFLGLGKNWTAKTLRITLYTKDWGRFPKVGLGLVPEILTAVGTLECLASARDLFP